MAGLAPGLRLKDVHLMPAIGVGTHPGPKYDYDAVVSFVRSAISAGYRHIDTAVYYGSETATREAIRREIEAGSVKREQLFITAKLPLTSHRTELVVPALRKRLSALGLEYVDMFLIHWPCPMVPTDSEDEAHLPKDDKGEFIYDDNVTLAETWLGMEQCKTLGLAKSIGLSNCNKGQISSILDQCLVKPSCIHIESNPYFTNDELIRFCQTEGISVACYSPLRSYGWHESGPRYDIWEDEHLKAIAVHHKKSVAQIALKFQIQRGCAVITKSVDRARQEAALDLNDFHLINEEMQTIYEKCDKNERSLWCESLLGKSKGYPFELNPAA